MNVRFRGPLLSADDVRAVERQYGFRFPEDYVAFILEHNGGRPVPATFDITGPNNASLLNMFYALKGGESYADFHAKLRMFRKRIPAEFVPIASDAGGNQILMAIDGPDYGTIHFWDHEEEAERPKDVDRSNMTRIASSFREFIDRLYETPDE